MVFVGIGGKSMVWAARALKVAVTGVAGAKFGSPDWLAVTMTFP